MRIISGRFKGQQIAIPKSVTRLTTDRAKEAIFSHLESHGFLAEARVLDLYAGTGALGFEALSRGAKLLIAVEANAAAAGLIGKTAQEILKNPASDGVSIRVMRGKAEKFAEKFAPKARESAENRAFDVVFIDPPYAVSTQDCNNLIEKLISAGIVAQNGTVMIERSSRSDDISPPLGWQISQRKTYGETVVFYLENQE